MNNKPFWDIDESHIIINNLRIINIEKNKKIALGNMDYVNRVYNNLKLCAYITRQLPNKLTLFEKNGIDIFISTPHIFIEMNPTEYKFIILNKKINITDIQKIPHNTDKTLRASYKVVLLKFRDPKGNITLNKIKLTQLLVHELAHTLANHVVYRHDDHGEDFKIFERMLMKWCIILKYLNSYEYF